MKVLAVTLISCSLFSSAASQAQTGVGVIALQSGIPWRMLPKTLGCGSGMTCWRRLRDWQSGQRFGLHNLRHSLSSWLVNKGKVNVVSTTCRSADDT